MTEEFKRDDDWEDTEEYEPDDYVYLVELDICGCKGKIFMEIAAKSAEDAWRTAKMDITELRGNDCSVESVSKVVRPDQY
jgi:hypothetical protein